jgi:hypothetical protein
MNSSLIGKIEKARRYEHELDRIHFHKADIEFRGEHDNYVITLDGSNWHCSCHTFATGFDTCSHIMALQRIMHDMVEENARYQHETRSIVEVS